MREVDMLPLLREILIEHKAADANTGADHPVFRHRDRQAALAPQPSPGRGRGGGVPGGGDPGGARWAAPAAGITPHKLRHTSASVLIAIGKDPIYVMSQLGHTDPAFTLRVYGT